jgi:hypothetical protein
MTLEQWLNNRWLVEHETSQDEIDGFLSLVERDLQNAAVAGLSPDWGLAIAYNAALQCALAALAAHGFRPGRGSSHHYYAIQSLQFTLGIDDAVIRTLDAFRKKRNIADYERAGVVTSTEVGELIELATDLRDRLSAWLSSNRPDLLGEA